VIAPPTLICETNQYTGRLRDEEGFPGHSWDLTVPGSRQVRGGNSYVFHRPIRPDDVVTATWRIDSATERVNARGQDMLVLGSRAVFTDAAGGLLATNEETIIYVALEARHAPAEAGPRPKAPAGPPPEPPAGEIAPGTVLPVLERRIELADMIAYAGATWDWHRLHYDPAYLAAKRLTTPVVDGQLFGALLAEHVQDWLGPRCELRTLSFRFKNMVFAGETVRCHGTVTAVDDGVITIEQRVEAAGDGRLAVAPAGSTAVVRS
jgi:acyl dehydratase